MEGEEFETFNSSSLCGAKHLSVDVLYHGGPAEVVTPDLRKQGNTKDFGWGFYCTNIQQQAERWAVHKGAGAGGVVSIYSWNPGIVNTLKCLEFSDIGTDAGLDLWLDAIISNRSAISGEQVHDFDIVAGPMGDDQLWIPVAAYARNPTEDNMQRIRDVAKFQYHTQQIVFCTDRALKALRFVSSYTT